MGHTKIESKFWLNNYCNEYYLIKTAIKKKLNFTIMKQKVLLLFSALLLLTQLVSAQGITTGIISGRVTDSKGAILPGVTIEAVHQPSGSKYSTSTRGDGRFNLPGVRVGGPYTITISFIGYGKEVINDGMVGLGESLTLNVTLKDASQQLAEVAIVGSKGDKTLNSKKNGAGLLINRSTIDNLPTISRSLTDFTRLVPQAGSQGMLGKGAKSNNISVDGAAFNNAFGLGFETNNLPGTNTNAQPISLDAIDQIAVDLSPYNVTQGGFTGASVNAVTRSGDNEVRGSVYDFFRNQNLVGAKVKDVTITKTPFNENTFGFRIGGPLIKNKLFFFANYEQFSNTQPGANFQAAAPGLSGGNISNVKASDLDALGSYLQSTYNYNAGAYQNYNLATKNKKFLLKLDWNIDDKNKVSIRYNQLNASATFGATSTLSAIGFNNNGYIRYNDIYSITGEWNSTISNKISNRFFSSYTSQPDYRGYFGDLFPTVNINDNGNTYTFGTNFAALDNHVSQSITQLQDDITFNLDKHKLSAGVTYQYLNFSNQFTLNPLGTFTFSTLANFYNSSPLGTQTPIGTSTGKGLPSAYTLGYTVQPGNPVTIDHPRFSQTGLYVQDEFFPATNFKITAGLRADVTAFLNKPEDNTAVANYSFQNATGGVKTYNTTHTPGKKILVSPRIGFNWDISGDRSLQLRGGSGLFAGNIPFVFIEKAYAINGLNEGAISATNAAAAAAYPFNPNPKAYVPANGTLAPNYELDLVSPNFKMPQTWRSTLGLDARLPGNVVSSTEAVYSKDINSPYYLNANLNYNTATTATDGRLQYASNRINRNITGAYVLGNTSYGHQIFLTQSFNKQFDTNFAASVAYTYGISKDAFTFRSTTPGGAFNAIPVVGNPNIPVESYGDFDLKHRIVGSINYKINYAKNKMASSIGIFFEGAQQGRGSYTYGGSGDVNKDGTAINDLIFVPATQSQINLVASSTATVQQQWDALNTFISDSKYLSSRRGQYAERDGILLPWYFQTDLKFAQDFSGMLHTNKNTLEFTVDILNFTNLLNKNWGVLNTIANPTPITALTSTTFQVNPALLQRGEFIQDNGLSSVSNPASSSRYRIQFGVRYLFN